MNARTVYDADEIKRRLESVFRASGVKRAVLFGSYARGEASADSDIVILVVSGRRGLDFVELIEYVREALQKEVDVIDTHYIDKNSRIEHEANRTGVVIYDS
jgi:predicted nucleotidyltransferase